MSPLSSWTNHSTGARVSRGWTDPAHSALAHHAAVRLAFRRESWHTRGPDIRGYRSEVTVEKNKLGQERKSVTLDILFNGTVRGDGI